MVWLLLVNLAVLCSIGTALSGNDVWERSR